MPTNEIVIEILSKDDCCLCDEAKKILDAVIPDYPAKLVVIDIENDHKLMQLFGEKIPVIRVDGEEWFKFKVSENVLRLRLDDYLKNK
jgi:glutaredoxin